MLAGAMTNIQQVNIWVESEAFLEGSSPDPLGLQVIDRRARPWSRGAARALR